MSDDRLDSAQAFELSPEQLAQLRSRIEQPAPAAPAADPAAFALWPDTWLPVRLFIAMSTQWTDAGLRLEALPMAARSAGIRRGRGQSPSVLADLRVMEAAGLQWLDDRRNNPQLSPTP